MAAGRGMYGEDIDPIPAFFEPTVIFMINRSLQGDFSINQHGYKATRCSWIIGKDARKRAVYALGVSNGVVRFVSSAGYLLVVADGVSRACPPQNLMSSVRVSPG